MCSECNINITNFLPDTHRPLGQVVSRIYIKQQRQLSRVSPFGAIDLKLADHIERALFTTLLLARLLGPLKEKARR